MATLPSWSDGGEASLVDPDRQPATRPTSRGSAMRKRRSIVGQRPEVGQKRCVRPAKAPLPASGGPRRKGDLGFRDALDRCVTKSKSSPNPRSPYLALYIPPFSTHPCRGRFRP